MPVDMPVSWTEIHCVAKKLSAAIRQNGTACNKLIAVTRGGLVPACLVARDLDIRDIVTVSVQSYDHQSQSAAKVLNIPEGIGTGKGCLIVDDLADTGNTFRALRTILPDATYACLYVKPEGKPTADIYATEIPQDNWVYFPWEDQDFPPHIADTIGGHLK